MKKNPRKIIAGVLIVLLIAAAAAALDYSFRHEWTEATCTTPKTCTRCGKTEGEPLGHTWKAATCTKPKTCSVCGKTKGKKLGHTYGEWTVTKEATCTKKGKKKAECTVCGHEATAEIETIAHQPGDWEITKEATVDEAGERSKKCKVCGTVVDTESYELSPEELEDTYKASCETYSYDTIARDPDQYKGTKAKYTGKVIQVLEGDSYNHYRVNVTRGSYGIYKDTIMVYYAPSSSESRILEDDIVTIYGENSGTISYETIMGATVTIPAVVAKYMNVQ